jgi:hypothetical protein
MRRPIELIRRGLDVQALYWALQENPQLWNQHPGRTVNPASPHHGLDDIWVRFGDPQRMVDNAPHEAHWYPAADVLPVRELCLDIADEFGRGVLGGVLMTRIPAGKHCRPHADGGWHALQYDKYAVQVTSAPGQRFCFDNAWLESRPGDLFRFDNQFTHWVENDTPYERVTLIVCVGKEK